jgi:pimeloyl-ACP methyl ester carboxylesterase
MFVPELQLDDVTLHYDQSGSGPDVVWLAAGDQPGDRWRLYQTPAFDAFLRSCTYDARGVGRTVSASPPPWPIPVHARDCAALIERACTPPVALVGLSMGSLIAQELCCTRPDLVRCAVVAGTCVRKTGFMSYWEEAEISLRSSGKELPPEFAVAHYAFLYYPADALGDDETWRRVKPLLEEDFAHRDGEMLAAQWQACLDYDSSPRLPSCQVPIHAIAFSEDVQTPPGRVREVAELAGNGSFHLLRGLGHGSAFGHRPEVVNECLRTILASYFTEAWPTEPAAATPQRHGVPGIE